LFASLLLAPRSHRFVRITLLFSAFLCKAPLAEQDPIFSKTSNKRANVVNQRTTGKAYAFLSQHKHYARIIACKLTRNIQPKNSAAELWLKCFFLGLRQWQTPSRVSKPMRTVNMSVANWWLNNRCTTLRIPQKQTVTCRILAPARGGKTWARARSHVSSSRAPGLQSRKSGRAAGWYHEKKNPVWNRQPGKKEKNSTLTAAMRQNGILGFCMNVMSLWMNIIFEFSDFLRKRQVLTTEIER